MIPLNVCEPSVPPSTQNPSVSWYVNDPFGKLQKFSRMNLNIWGTTNIHFQKRKQKCPVVSVPGSTVRNYKILGIPESLHRRVTLPPPYVQRRIDSWKCCFFEERRKPEYPWKTTRSMDEN